MKVLTSPLAYFVLVINCAMDFEELKDSFNRADRDPCVHHYLLRIEK